MTVTLDLSNDPPTLLQQLADAINGLNAVTREIAVRDGSSLSAALTIFLPTPAQTLEILGITIVSDTATTGSTASSKEWIFDLYNVTAGVSLFSALPTTATSQAGIGGGEIAANSPYVLTPDQNQVVATSDVLEFRITLNGAPTTLARYGISLDVRGSS